MNVLETERLTLRRVTVEDSEFILELLNDPSWLRFIGDKGVRTIDDAREYILKSLVAMYERLGFGLYLTVLKNEGVPNWHPRFNKKRYFRGCGYWICLSSAVLWEGICV